MRAADSHCLAVLALFVAGVPAQTPTTDPLGPGVYTGHGNPSRNAELGSPALGDAVGTLFLMRGPAGGTPRFVGAATVRRPGRSDWDPITFAWNGPGSAPSLDGADGALYTAALIGPGDEYQIGLRHDGLCAVTDTGAAHPTGGGRAVIATRAQRNAPFGNVRAIQGVPASYIDPQLGVLDGNDVLFWADPSGDVRVGEIDCDPTSPGYGGVKNARVAVRLDPNRLPGLLAWRSPTPIADPAGESVSLWCAALMAGSGADVCWQSAPDQSRFAPGTVFPQQVVDSGADWATNPGAYFGSCDVPTTSALGTVGAPTRIDVLALSSSAVPAASGGTSRNFAWLPFGLTANTSLVAFVNYGPRLATPLPLATLQATLGRFGLRFHGGLGVDPFASVLVPLRNGALDVLVPWPAGAPVTLRAEALVFDPATNDVLLSNAAYVARR
jgi:hypothetical protein